MYLRTLLLSIVLFTSVMVDIEELLRVCSDDDSITRSCSSPDPAASGLGGGKSGPPPLDLSITVDSQGVRLIG